jgi:hypothetical protein
VAINAPAPKPPAAKKPAVTKVVRLLPDDRLKVRASGLEDWFSIGGLYSVMRGQLADAQACEDHGSRISAAIAAYADENEKIGEYVDYIVQMGPVAALIAVTMPFVMQLAVNHGRLRAEGLGDASGVQPPELLESRMRLKIQQQKLRLEKEAAEARIEIERLQRESREADGT